MLFNVIEFICCRPSKRYVSVAFLLVSEALTRRHYTSRRPQGCIIASTRCTCLISPPPGLLPWVNTFCMPFEALLCKFVIIMLVETCREVLSNFVIRWSVGLLKFVKPTRYPSRQIMKLFSSSSGSHHQAKCYKHVTKICSSILWNSPQRLSSLGQASIFIGGWITGLICVFHRHLWCFWSICEFKSSFSAFTVDVKVVIDEIFFFWSSNFLMSGTDLHFPTILT